MKILIFTEGTILIYASAIGKSRDQIIQQIIDKEISVDNYQNYVPKGKAIEKITKWKEQGADIYYLTSRTTKVEIDHIKNILSRYNFPDCKHLLFRNGSESYEDVAQKLMPDVLIEDDCESIGGEIEMTYPHIKPELKARVKSVIVKEFAGIDNLPDLLENLLMLK